MESFGVVALVEDASTPQARRLVASLGRFNEDGVPVEFVVPSGSRELAKFEYASSGRLDHYLIVDERVEFLRPFKRRDFMLDDAQAFISASSGDELRVDPHFECGAWAQRLAHHGAAAQALDLLDPSDLAMPEFVTFSSATVRDLCRHLESGGQSLDTALASIPQAEAWYFAWLRRVDSTLPALREPNIKTLQSREEFLGYIVRGVLREDLARGYVAIGHELPEMDVAIGDPDYLALARVLTRAEILAAIRYRLHRKVIVEKEPLKRARTQAGALALRVPLLRNLVDVGQNRPPEI